MQLKKTRFLLILVLLSGMSLQAMVDDGQELPTREKIRKILIGPVMGFGVAATAAYCASKEGWGSSPLSMICAFAVYNALHWVVARKGERYNKWQVIPAMTLGYCCGYYIGCPAAAPSISELCVQPTSNLKKPYIGTDFVKRDNGVDFSTYPNHKLVRLTISLEKVCDVYVSQNATWEDVKKAFVDQYKNSDPLNDSLTPDRLRIIGNGRELPDDGFVFNPVGGEFNYCKEAAIYLAFKRD